MDLPVLHGILIAAPGLAGTRERAHRLLATALGDLDPRDLPRTRAVLDFTANLAVAPGFLQGLVESLLGHRPDWPVALLAVKGLDVADNALLLDIAHRHRAAQRIEIFSDRSSTAGEPAGQAALRARSHWMHDVSGLTDDELRACYLDQGVTVPSVSTVPAGPAAP